jgi:hypothetical protein
MFDRRTLCLLAAMLLGGGCSDSTGLRAALGGDWNHLDPAFSYNMTLMTDASAVRGVGQWSGEACCQGTVEVHGTTTGHTVQLDLDFAATPDGLQPGARFSQHFTGRLVGTDSLDGFLTVDDQIVQFGYHRTRSVVVTD